MKRLSSRRLVILATLLTFFTGLRAADAGPFEELFRGLREALKDDRSRAHRSTTRKQQTQSTTSNTAGAESAKSTGPPNQGNTRTTAQVKTSTAKSNLKYGTPVPGRKGLVVSPFSPDAGYIDVRGFPPGTPVKDPYSGKIFLTP